MWPFEECSIGHPLSAAFVPLCWVCEPVSSFSVSLCCILFNSQIDWNWTENEVTVGQNRGRIGERSSPVSPLCAKDWGRISSFGEEKKGKEVCCKHIYACVAGKTVEQNVNRTKIGLRELNCVLRRQQKDKRKKQQEENVKKKQAKQEELKQKTLAGMSQKDSKESKGKFRAPSSRKSSGTKQSVWNEHKKLLKEKVPRSSPKIKPLQL